MQAKRDKTSVVKCLETIYSTMTDCKAGCGIRLHFNLVSQNQAGKEQFGLRKSRVNMALVEERRNEVEIEMPWEISQINKLHRNKAFSLSDQRLRFTEAYRSDRQA